MEEEVLPGMALVGENREVVSFEVVVAKCLVDYLVRLLVLIDQQIALVHLEIVTGLGSVYSFVIADTF